jgi:uncharacterized protein with HEPN domain
VGICYSYQSHSKTNRTARKNLDKVSNKSLLICYPQIDWKKAIGMRDIISHHYFDVDAEVIFDVCKTKINKLSEIIKKIKRDLLES